MTVCVISAVRSSFSRSISVRFFATSVSIFSVWSVEEVGDSALLLLGRERKPSLPDCRIWQPVARDSRCDDLKLPIHSIGLEST